MRCASEKKSDSFVGIGATNSSSGALYCHVPRPSATFVWVTEDVLEIPKSASRARFWASTRTLFYATMS
jgi:hypothetical protein